MTTKIKGHSQLWLGMKQTQHWQKDPAKQLHFYIVGLETQNKKDFEPDRGWKWDGK